MEQTINTTTPAELSPEFTDWLNTEKVDAKRHQMRLFRATLLMLFGTALFLLKMQPNWLFDMFGLAGLIPN